MGERFVIYTIDLVHFLVQNENLARGLSVLLRGIIYQDGFRKEEEFNPYLISTSTWNEFSRT